MRVSKHTGKIPEVVRDEIVASFYRWEPKASIANRLPVARRTVTRICSELLKNGG